MKTVSFPDELVKQHGLRHVVVAVGVFDGVHRGHQRILSALLHTAAAEHAVPVVLTFDPHPRAVLFPQDAPSLLTLRERKLHLLQKYGVRAVIFLPFSRQVAALPPREFVRRILLGGDLDVRGVCVGSQWRFGHRGVGDTELLQRIGRERGFTTVCVPEKQYYGRPVSSTRIREAIGAGRLEHATRMLGHAYRVCGIVERGLGIGSSEFDCPTANISDPRIVLPPDGVYAGRAWVGTERQHTPHPGVVYVGRAPTVGCGGEKPTPVVELHLFDWDDDLYGHAIEVEFAHFLRPDRLFPSREKLRQQIHRDVDGARRCLAGSARATQ